MPKTRKPTRSRKTITRATSIVLPQKKLLVDLTTFFQDAYGNVMHSINQASFSSTRPTRSSSKFKRFFSRFPKKRILILAGSLVAIIAGITILPRIFYRNTPGQIAGTSNSTSQPTVAAAIASQDVNQELTFPLKDESDEEISSIKYLIEKAEVRNEIIVQGKRALAVEGRAFLILTLKITNNFSQPIEIDTRDYMRLIVDGNQEEKLAPEIHNDPVEVQAISVKYTRLGFAIDQNYQSLALQVGEINGDKQEIQLELK